MAGKQILLSSYKVKSMTDAKKLKKKRRSQLQLLNQDDVDIEILNEPSLFVYIANGGVAMGISRDLLWHILSPFGAMTIITPSRKQYAFAIFSSVSQTESVVSALNGRAIQVLCKNKSLLNDYLSGGPPLNIYLSYVATIPTLFTTEQHQAISAPSGLVLIPNFISEAEETLLLNFFDFAGGKNNTDSCDGLSNILPKMELKHRKVMHYGYEFNYATNNVNPTKPLPGGLPEICTPIIAKMMHNNLIANKPDQLTVNQYFPGQGIPSHVDTHSAFEDGIVSITLGCHTVMDFRNQYSEEKVSVLLPRRSILIMTGESRLKWTHRITARKFDIVHSTRLVTDQAQLTHYNKCFVNQIEKFIIIDCNDSTVVERAVRTSLTLRKIRCLPCKCGFSLTCS